MNKPAKSSFFHELRDSLPKSVAPVLLTILGALAFQGAVSTVSFPDEEKQLTERINAEKNRDISLLANEKMIQEAVVSSIPNHHLKVIGDFQNAIPTMDEEERARFQQKLFTALDEANGKLGTLEGYTGLDSPLPSNLLASRIQLVSADLETVQTALSCSEKPLNASEAKLDCLSKIRKESSQLGRAIQRTVSAGKAAQAASSMFDADRKHRWDADDRELETFFRKRHWALYGLVLSLLGYGLIFHFFILWSTPTGEGKKHEDKAEEKHKPTAASVRT